MINKYIPVDYYSDVDEGVFDYQQYGHAVFRLAEEWKDITQEDIIMYNDKKDKTEFEENMLLVV